MNELELAGSHREIGEQHGAALRGEIRECLTVYRQLWRRDEAELQGLGGGFLAAVEGRLPHLAEEIRGVAAGSDQPVQLISAINARTELLTDIEISECTAVGVGSRYKRGFDTVLAQNWDWMNSFRGLTRVVTLRPTDRPALKMLIEPGMIGKIGLNEAGLGVCLNFLPTESPNPDGIPVHVMLRAILECSSSAEAEELIRSTPRAACANYLIGDAQDVICCLETRPDQVSRLTGEEFVAHTNSFNADGESCARQQAFEKALTRFRALSVSGQISPEKLRESFTIPGVEFPGTNLPGGIETIHTIVLNLTRKRLLVSDGARSKDEFRVHSFEN